MNFTQESNALERSAVYKPEILQELEASQTLVSLFV